MHGVLITIIIMQLGSYSSGTNGRVTVIPKLQNFLKRCRQFTGRHDHAHGIVC